MVLAAVQRWWFLAPKAEATPPAEPSNEEAEPEHQRQAWAEARSQAPAPTLPRTALAPYGERGLVWVREARVLGCLLLHQHQQHQLSGGDSLDTPDSSGGVAVGVARRGWQGQGAAAHYDDSHRKD